MEARDVFSVPATVLADPFVALPPLRPSCRISVVIPARNEADRIGRTLQALVAQTQLDGTRFAPDAFDVIIYANNCQDRTAQVVRAFAARHPDYAIYVAEESLPAKVAHIGTARRAAMHAAAARYRAARIDGVLAATDADTVAAPMWLAWNLREMQAADAVMGRILVDPVEWDGLPAHTQRMLVEEHAYQFALVQLRATLHPSPHDPWPRHWQRSGPSFAVRVSAYDAVGGVPPVRALEDIALYDALVRHGARIRHSLRVRVTTSARFGSRAPGGFGARISEWSELSETGQRLLVEDPVVSFERLRESGLLPPADHRATMPAVQATEILRGFIAAGAGCTKDRSGTASDLAS